MISYKPLLDYMEDHGISFYKLEEMTGISHGSIYEIKHGDSVTLPTINAIMYSLNFHSFDQVLKYYRDGTEEPPAGDKPIARVDEFFKVISEKKSAAER